MMLLVGAIYSNAVANVIETLVSLVGLNVEAKTATKMHLFELCCRS